MRKSFFPGTTGIFALFFVPYIVTIIFNGANTTLINKKFNVEMLLPVIVSSQIEDKYELETIKAQTIIARSNFYRTMKEEKNLAITLCQIKEEMEGKSLACVILQNKYEKAVTETTQPDAIANAALTRSAAARIAMSCAIIPTPKPWPVHAAGYCWFRS